MKNLIILACLCTIGANSLNAQYFSGVTIPDTTKAIPSDIPSTFAAEIIAEEMKEHLYTLASDEFGGRELGTEGNLLAADYIANHFDQIGLSTTGPEDSYFQKVAFSWVYWDDISINVAGARYKHLWDFIAFPNQNESMTYETDEVVFLGYGIDDAEYSDYKKAKVKDKTILIYQGEPINNSGHYILTDSPVKSKWSEDIKLKLKAASDHGAKQVLIIAQDLKKMIEDNRRTLLGPQVVIGEPNTDINVNFAYISSTMAKSILGEQVDKVIKARKCIEKKGKSKPVKIKTALSIEQTKKVDRLDGVNVCGLVEGSDKKDEYIILSAHYDHIGKKGRDINNGADDNASGTTTVLELAQSFARAKKKGHGPRRSIIFALVTGEEKGLLGSSYYVENPLFPLDKTMANINIDMVGRLHSKYLDNPNYIYVIGSDRLSTDLHKINEEVNGTYSHLTMDYTYNDAKDPNRFYFRSDHYNFAKNGIPSIFFFNGTHEDYHRPTDTADKIEYDKMAKIGRHIFHLTWDLANREQSISVDVAEE